MNESNFMAKPKNDVQTSRWIIVSNRLPFQIDAKSGKLVKSSGGLVTAVSDVKVSNMIWVGALPGNISPSKWKKVAEGRGEKLHPVMVAAEDYDAYYNGIGNDVLWPLLHYETSLVKFNAENWEMYRRVNMMFAREILAIAKENDLIWVHDFHLFLLPGLLHGRKKNIKIGFFLHVPFPSSEVFRQLPVRDEILESLLKSDLVGFHDYSYLRHFSNTVQSILGHEPSLLNIHSPEHETELGVFPVGINTPKLVKASAAEDVAGHIKTIKTTKYLILGVDRLDYTKGIELKFQAFREFLQAHPEMVAKTTLVQIAVPSRENVAEYMKLRNEVERLTGQINGEFGTPTHTPLHYIHSGVHFKELLALYRAADVLLVTSKRDGMNLVALEFVACQDSKNPGVVLLSEFAGAISILSAVVPINPWDTPSIAKKIYEALTMDPAQKKEKQKIMMKHLSTYTSETWAQSFMTRLEACGRTSGGTVRIDSTSLKSILGKSVSNKNRILLLDYDGTLVSIRRKPKEAIIEKWTERIIGEIAANKKNKIVIVSGRDSSFLMAQFKGFPVYLAAEHGALFYDLRKKRWRSLVRTDIKSWYSSAEHIMKDFMLRTPGSVVEKKRFAISWHYRESPDAFGGYQARRLLQELHLGLANLPVTIIRGKKVVEARAADANKGAFSQWYLDRTAENDEFVFAIGDDETDEDTFSAVAERGTTVKVGPGQTTAQYRLSYQEQVLPLLHKLFS